MRSETTQQHTPGPWVVRIGSSGHLVQIHRVEPIGAGPMVARVYSDEAIGDAHLIAAAPELLEALKIYVHANGNGVPPHIEAAARAAIAKAEGR